MHNYLHKAWKRHQDAVSWVDINLANTKGLKFYQTRSNAIILQETLPAYCTPKVVRMETGEVLYEKVYVSPRPPPKISLKHERKRELGSEHAQRFIERAERPVVDHDNLSHEKIMVNEADMDFRNPGLPQSVVKHAQSTSVRELIQKIENHPDRHALQQDLRNQAFNPFSPESKIMIQDVGNIELCELFETEPKTQCTACLSYWNIGIVYCTCGHFLQKETAVNRKFLKNDGLSFSPLVCHQEGKTSWTQIWEKARRQRILSG